MPSAGDITGALREQVREAAARQLPVAIVGGGTKSFLGRETPGEALRLAAHSGIVSYEPTELVVTARAGTRLDEVEAALAERDQMLAFEPPHFGTGATLGGAIAAGLSGPRRPYAGAVRDFVLGTKVLNGKAEVLEFGGQVMKNVAGYDVSRLMAGSMGTLAVILEVSLKVLPVARATVTLGFELDAGAAVERMNAWAATPLPISGACHDGERALIRLSGTPGGVSAAVARMGGERCATDEIWTALREHELAFFDGTLPLWRLSVPPATPNLALEGAALIDWGGAQRWLRSDAPAERVRAVVGAACGHATLFRHQHRDAQVFHPPEAGILRLHQRLKAAFDPEGIFNPGRMYAEL